MDENVDRQEWLGVIFDTESHGRWNVIVGYTRLLCVRGNYWNTVKLAAGGVALGAAAGRLTTGSAKESALIAEVMNGQDKRAQQVIELDQIAGVVLRKRWYGHSMEIHRTETAAQKFSWKPRLNDFDHVRSMLVQVLGERVVLQDERKSIMTCG